jgi:hypothetical protein
LNQFYYRIDSNLCKTEVCRQSTEGCAIGIAERGTGEAQQRRVQAKQSTEGVQAKQSREGYRLSRAQRGTG